MSDFNEYRVRKVQDGNHFRDSDNRMETSSQKDVSIGLDLLVNPDKKLKLDDDRNVVNLNDLVRQSQQQSRPGTPLDDFDFSDVISRNKQMNPEEHIDSMLHKIQNDRQTRNRGDTSSRPSQHDIDHFIDKEDSRSRQPQLIDENEITHLVDEDAERQSPRDDRRYQEEYERRSRQEYDRQSRNSRSDVYAMPKIDPIAERKEKEKLLWHLEKYRRQGVQLSQRYNMSSDIDEMRHEYNKIKDQRALDSSIKFQRKTMMMLVSGLEALNNKFDYFDIHLDGWTEHVKDEIDDYNEVFEELHEKYAAKTQIAPELRLLMMLGGSAFMFHLTNAMTKGMPSLEDMLRKDPQLMRQFMNSAVNQMQGEQKQAAQMFSQYAPMNRPPPQPQGSQEVNRPYYSSPPAPMNTRPNTQSDDFADSFRDKPVRKIPQPVGVDEILNELKSNTEDIVSETVSMNKSMNGTRRKMAKPKRSIQLDL